MESKFINKATFSKLIQNLRFEKQMTLYQMGQLLKTGAGTVSRWENGTAAPPGFARWSIIERILEFDVKVETENTLST